ncbi:hypothetical protein JFT66_17515 [Pseudomonas sp. MF6755]|uniref:hypothetical protein n=1 Tax=Pseudomonas sp. MF6755 TaxID=2797530 RepID=UPI0018E88010|nr:hypothetical protein [Pseudomonas sp. MF6755]MBJ2285956.1 hypothetical protein [Pseudomonas sp. MF6755]
MWWEKTVEYTFVQRFMPNFADGRAEEDRYLAPLDGDHEKAGDAIMAIDTKMVLIEFKRSLGEVNSELRKFPNFESTRRALKKTDRHHLLVYGMASKGSQLELAARTYFSESEVEIKKITTEGKTYDDFLIYLNKFLKFKYPKGGGGSDKKSPDSPTDDIGGLEYIVVIGIVSGEPRFAMSLRDFLSYKRPDGGSTATIPLTPKSPEGAAVKLEKMAEPLMVTTN